jgi:stage V sporulation protein B
MKDSILKSCAYVTIFSTIEKFLSFVYRIILSRLLGAEGVGIYHICLSVFGVLLTSASGGIPITLSRLITKCKVQNKQYFGYVTAAIILTLTVTVPLCLLCLLFKDVFCNILGDEKYVNAFLLLLPGLILTSIYSVIRGSFWGNKAFLPYSLIELAEDAVMVVAGTLLLLFATSVYSRTLRAIIAVVISYIFSFVVSLFVYVRQGGRFKSPFKYFKPLLTSSLPITLMRTFSCLLNCAVSLFLPALLCYMCGYTKGDAVAIYGAVLGMGLPILFIPNSLIGSISVVTAPRMSGNFYSNDDENLKRDIVNTLNACMVLATLLTPILFATGNDVGLLLYDNALSGRIISYYCFILLPMSITMMTTTILNSLHQERRTLAYYLIGAVVMIATILLLIKYLAADAYMVGLLLSFVVTAALNLSQLSKKFPNTKIYSRIAKYAACIMFACIFSKLFMRLLPTQLGYIAKIILCSLPTLAFTFACMYCLGLYKPSAIIGVLPALCHRKKLCKRKADEEYAERPFKKFRRRYNCHNAADNTCN